MVNILLHSPVLGKNPGATVDVPSDEADWYLQQGYASKVRGAKDEEFGRYATSAPAEHDPTLAENRGAPADVEPHLSNGEHPDTSEQVKIETDDKGKAAPPKNEQPSGGPDAILETPVK